MGNLESGSNRAKTAVALTALLGVAGCNNPHRYAEKAQALMGEVSANIAQAQRDLGQVTPEICFKPWYPAAPEGAGIKCKGTNHETDFTVNSGRSEDRTYLMLDLQRSLPDEDLGSRGNKNSVSILFAHRDNENIESFEVGSPSGRMRCGLMQYGDSVPTCEYKDGESMPITDSGDVNELFRSASLLAHQIDDMSANQTKKEATLKVGGVNKYNN